MVIEVYLQRHKGRADDDEPFLPGFRGGDGAYGSEMWDPDKPPPVHTRKGNG